MFDPIQTPRVFGMPPGADFGQAFVTGLEKRFGSMTQTQVARTEIYVNTSRMQRRLRDVFDDGAPRLLPRIRLVTDLALDHTAFDIPAPVAPLWRRLELSQAVARLLDKEDTLAPRAALYDLSDSLAALMDEMQGEGIPPSALARLDVSDQSGHWQRALKFLNLLQPYFEVSTDTPDTEARQRLIIERRIAHWADHPPEHPIIVAGSTGSRGATRLFMEAVARLPQGALVLPGFDKGMPAATWESLGGQPPQEDHPQYRFYKLLTSLALDPTTVPDWETDLAPDPERNRLVSLSLRPAPVTHQWLTEGPDLGDLMKATANMTLVEAASPRIEAETIALRLRQAAQDGIIAALITPDRMLTRQVAAALDRWEIEPDDSAGTPLAASAPGRFLRHVGQLIGTAATAEDVLVILKHPLCNTGGSERGPHLRHTRELELSIRRYGPPILTKEALLDWAERTGTDEPDRLAWAVWIGDTIDRLAAIGSDHLAVHLANHIAAATALARGPDGRDAGELWQKAAGREALKTCETLTNNAQAGGKMNTRDYTNLFNAVLSNGVVRDRDTGHPNILIWGTLEARVQGADLVILGGMNDGVWPESPAPDPWLNRDMRKRVGLLLPERRIGLSAHDYQQAIAAKEVWLTRSKRSADSETVPSRWVNRLCNLLAGLPKQNGCAALKTMRDKGALWMAQAIALEEPQTAVDKANRPSPRPPLDARPKELSVTRIKTLIRDPYAIYAERVLKLRPLDPLRASADPALRGEIFHKILELFIRANPNAADPAAYDQLARVAHDQLIKSCPWPMVRLQWQTRLERLAPTFLADEALRQQHGSLAAVEAWGELQITTPKFKIVGKADRIDMDDQGGLIIYDYKTGAVPSKPQQQKFDKQLLIEAAMAERGGFASLGPKTVSQAAFIGINTDMKVSPAPLKDEPTDKVWADFLRLLDRWLEPDRGYTARLAHFFSTDSSPYDHLSRFGEWTMADPISPEVLK